MLLRYKQKYSQACQLPLNMLLAFSTLLTILGFYPTINLYAADGDVLSGFNIGDTNGGNSILDIEFQSTGKIIVGGTFTAFNGNTANRLVRLNADGNVDTSFNTGSGFDGSVEKIEIQDDDKILVGGVFTSFNGVTSNRLVRLNADGSLDTSFNTNLGSGFSDSVMGIYIQPDGKIMIVGGFALLNGVSVNNMVRLNADGTRDTSFNSGASIGSNSVVIQQPDGKYIIAGNVNNYPGAPANFGKIMRILSDGTYDTSFNTGSGFDEEVYSAVLLDNGQILVAGDFRSYNGNSTRFLIKLNPDGTQDTSFNSGGTGPSKWVTEILVFPDGSIMIGGDFTSYNNVYGRRITKLNPDGTQDFSFDIGSGFGNDVLAMAKDSNNHVYAGGIVGNYKGTSGDFFAIENSIDTTQLPATTTYCGANNNTTSQSSTDTTVCLEIAAGIASIYAGDRNDNDDICAPGDDQSTIESIPCSVDERSVVLSSANVLNVRQETTTIVHDITIDDLRGLQLAQYAVDVTMCNLVGDQANPITYPLGYTDDGGATGLYARSDADNSGEIEAIKPASAVTAYSERESGNWTTGPDTQVTDTFTPISVYSTTGDVTPGRYDIDSVVIGFEIPAFIAVGNYTCDITYTLTV